MPRTMQDPKPEPSFEPSVNLTTNPPFVSPEPAAPFARFAPFDSTRDPTPDLTPDPPWSSDSLQPTETSMADEGQTDAPADDGRRDAPAGDGRRDTHAGDGRRDTAPRLGEVLEQLVSRRRPLGPARLAQIESVARQRGLRFGDAAVALGAATAEEVVNALQRQYHYPAGTEARGARSTRLGDHAARACAVMLTRPYSPQAEALRSLRSQLLRQGLRPDGDGARPLAIVSPDSGDGKTFLAANLGIALAQIGGRTLLVDADLRGPRLHAVLGLDDAIGLSSVLAGRTDLQAVRPVPSVPGLLLLGAGAVPPNPLELFERPLFERLLRHARTQFDHVIVDTPAAVYGSDAQAVADRCGAALIVARRHASRLPALHQLAARLAEGPSRVAGIVFNEFKG